MLLDHYPNGRQTIVLGSPQSPPIVPGFLVDWVPFSIVELDVVAINAPLQIPIGVMGRWGRVRRLECRATLQEDQKKYFYYLNAQKIVFRSR